MVEAPYDPWDDPCYRLRLGLPERKPCLQCASDIVCLLQAETEMQTPAEGCWLGLTKFYCTLARQGTSHKDRCPSAEACILLREQAETRDMTTPEYEHYMRIRAEEEEVLPDG